ncbi:hypothetical protein SK128_008320 [Halocaridina rubra]|uniref:Uncharacterized protein n=1 Tax=Halocaridina rubra TaxID=373956 RepID=A0AAN8XF04_HALRR
MTEELIIYELHTSEKACLLFFFKIQHKNKKALKAAGVVKGVTILRKQRSQVIEEVRNEQNTNMSAEIAAERGTGSKDAKNAVKLSLIKK